MKHIEAMLSLANEARHRGCEGNDPLWHAVADLEVQRLVQLGRSSDELSDEPCGYLPEPVVEFAPVLVAVASWQRVGT